MFCTICFQFSYYLVIGIMFCSNCTNFIIQRNNCIGMQAAPGPEKVSGLEQLLEGGGYFRLTPLLHINFAILDLDTNFICHSHDFLIPIDGLLEYRDH